MIERVQTVKYKPDIATLVKRIPLSLVSKLT